MSAALEATAEDSVRGVLQLLGSPVANLVAAGDVSGLHEVLGDARRHAGVNDASVVDEDGVLLPDGTEDGDRRFTEPELHP